MIKGIKFASIPVRNQDASLEFYTTKLGFKVITDAPFDGTQRWIELEAANLLVYKAAALYDRGEPCGAEANAAKYYAGEVGFKACETAVMTMGGMGYAKEFHLERYLREAFIPRIAPVSPHLILCFIAEKVLGMPKSY